MSDYIVQCLSAAVEVSALDFEAQGFVRFVVGNGVGLCKVER